MSDNVTPITETHTCPSCGNAIRMMSRYDGHSDTCMQPEIRMRRAEARIEQLTEVIHQLVAANNDSVQSICDLNKRLSALETPPNASTPSPEAEPSTQRSPVLAPGDGLSERSLQSLREGPFVDRGVRLPSYPGGSLSNPGAAEPPGEAPAGAVPAGDPSRDT